MFEPDFNCESVWIKRLERSGQRDATQAARWSSFVQNLSIKPVKTFFSRLEDRDDVEAKGGRTPALRIIPISNAAYGS